jgi:hypothetical protein
MPADAFVPYAPLNVLKPLADDVWIVDGPEIRFKYALIGVPFPTRMTVVRLPGGGVWIHSPVAPDEALMQQVSETGEVRFLIAPNTLHYWWVPDWKARFPDAEVHAVPGLEHAAKRSLKMDCTLGETPPAAWAKAIDQVMVRGDILTEAAFFHRPSRTLILTDLIENFELSRVRGFWLRLLLRLGGAADPDGKAPFDMQFSFRHQRSAMRAAVDRMIAWQPERIVVAHGRCYLHDAQDELRRAFRWVR